MHDDATTADVVVVGGGLAGLIAANTAVRSPGTKRVLLFEPHPLGGRARCDDRDGYLFDRGPRALYIGGEGDRTLQALGVDTAAGGPPTLDRAGAVYGGEVHRLPQGFSSALRSSLMTALEKFAFAKAFARVPRIDPSGLAGTSVAEWLDVMGLAGAPRHLIEALIRVATYADAPHQLDAGAAVAAIQAALSPGVRYLDGGWQSLVDALAAKAQNAGVELHREGVELVTADEASDTVGVRTSTGELRAGAVVLASGTPDVAARLLGGIPASWPPLGPPASAACLELGLSQPPARRFILGVDEPTYLSTHAPPARLAPPGHAVVHVMRYQAPDDDTVASEQRAILDRLARQAGITSDAIVSERFLARMVVSGATPTAASGGLAGRVPVAVAEHPGVHLAGDWVGPNGMLLDAVASSAVDAARQATGASATMAAA